MFPEKCDGDVMPFQFKILMKSLHVCQSLAKDPMTPLIPNRICLLLFPNSIPMHSRHGRRAGPSRLPYVQVADTSCLTMLNKARNIWLADSYYF